MEKSCGSCTYLDLSDGNCYGKYYCNKKWERHLATDTACSSYTKAYSRSSGAVKNAIDFSNSHTSSNCYITTILCEVLKLNDSNYYMEALRGFRNNYLQTKDDYKNLLVEYDIIGPIICENIRCDKQKRMIAAKMFYNYINPIVSLIEDKMYNDAVIRYLMMVEKLKNFYGIDRNVTNYEIDNCDISLAGHGRYIKKLDRRILIDKVLY